MSLVTRRSAELREQVWVQEDGVFALCEPPEDTALLWDPVSARFVCA
jgi:hypothetical protein